MLKHSPFRNLLQPVQRPLFLAPGQAYAHPADSLAIAEHLDHTTIEEQVAAYSHEEKSWYRQLHQAQRLWELALATPTTEQDMGYFTDAREIVQTVLSSDLPARHYIRFNAARMDISEQSFIARAFDNPLTPEIWQATREKNAHHTLDFLGDDPLSQREHGQVAEFVDFGYRLNGNYFPYTALWREEADQVVTDNHDTYMVYTEDGRRPLKVPVSVKFRYPPPRAERNGSIITVLVGKVALATAEAIAPYSQDFARSKALGESSWQQASTALRLAADIMISHALGEDVSVEDRAFLWTMTANLQGPVAKYADTFVPANYARNARAITAHGQPD